jgi:hypothetical protein
LPKISNVDTVVRYLYAPEDISHKSRLYRDITLSDLRARVERIDLTFFAHYSKRIEAEATDVPDVSNLTKQIREGDDPLELYCMLVRKEPKIHTLYIFCSYLFVTGILSSLVTSPVWVI